MENKELARILVVGIIVLGVGVPFAIGMLKPLIVLSSSMEPVMSPGDLVIVKETSPKDITTEDIMAFKDPSEKSDDLITHRVIGISQKDDKLQFTTKGDAMEEPDLTKTKGSNVVGKTVFNIPYLGYLFHYGRSPLMFVFLIMIPAVLIMWDETRKISESVDPVKARESRWKEIREKKRSLRKITDYKISRLLLIFLISLAFFGMLSYSDLQNSGENVEKETISSGIIPSIVVYKTQENSIKTHLIVSGEENLENLQYDSEISMISSAPHILPAFWISELSDTNTILPSLLTSILPSILVTVVLYPIWRRTINRGSPKRRK